MYKPGQIITYKEGLKYRCVKNKTSATDCDMCDIFRYDSYLLSLIGIVYRKCIRKCSPYIYFKCIDNKGITF